MSRLESVYLIHAAKMLQLILVRALALTVLLASCRAAKLSAVPDFGANPSSITMAIYVPDQLPVQPAIIVVVGSIWSNRRAVTGIH